MNGLFLNNINKDIWIMSMLSPQHFFFAFNLIFSEITRLSSGSELSIGRHESQLERNLNARFLSPANDHTPSAIQGVL